MGNVRHETQMMVLSTVFWFYKATERWKHTNWEFDICVTVSCSWRQRNRSTATHLLTFAEPIKQDLICPTSQGMLVLYSINTAFVVSNRRRTIFCLGNSWPIPSQGMMRVSKDDGLCSDIENERKGPMLQYVIYIYCVSSLSTSSPKMRKVPLLLLLPASLVEKCMSKHLVP